MKKYLFIICIGIIGISSCDEEPLESLTTLSEVTNAAPDVIDNLEIQIKVGEVFENVNNLVSTGDLKSFEYSGPVITKDGNTYTLDYANVSGYAGSIIVEFSASSSVIAMGLSALITCNDFEDNGLFLNGSMELAFESISADNNITYSFESVNALQVVLEGDSFQWEFSYSIKTIDGFTSQEYLMNGYSKQTIDDVINYLDIKEDMYQGIACDYAMYGVVDCTFDQGSDSELVVSADFSVDENGDANNACDMYVRIYSGLISTVVSLN